MNLKLQIIGSVLCTGLSIAVSGCGGDAQQTKAKDFYTSGNREADQRADQRMAQKEELTGDSMNSEGKKSKSQAVLSDDKRPLYDQIGGSVGIKLIVDDFITRVMVDPRVNVNRVNIKRGGFNIHRGQSMTWDASDENISALKLHLSEFMSLSTGGPAKYTGEDLKSAATNMHYTNANFDAALGDLKATLDKLQIANKEQKNLLSVMETARDQIVQDR